MAYEIILKTNHFKCLIQRTIKEMKKNNNVFANNNIKRNQ